MQTSDRFWKCWSIPIISFAMILIVAVSSRAQERGETVDRILNSPRRDLWLMVMRKIDFDKTLVSFRSHLQVARRSGDLSAIALATEELSVALVSAERRSPTLKKKKLFPCSGH